VAVIDQSDLDRATAQALVDRRPAAVLNGAPVLSGRYPALGPAVLVDAGVLVVDGLGAATPEDGVTVRIHDGDVHVAGGDGTLLGTGRTVDRATLDADLVGARDGMASQLESFTHNSTEFLRREQDLLLHGEGLPRLTTRISGRPTIVVVPGRDVHAELARVRRFAREQDPVVVGVGRGADMARAAGLRPHVVVVEADADDADLPDAVTFRRAADLVVVVARGSAPVGLERFERLGLRPLRLESGATAEDAALLLADTGAASVVVGVGMHATLDEFLDRRRSGLASTYLTRLKVGERLVDASALPTLYSGRVRPWHLVSVGLAGLVALGAAIGVTPVGQEWVSGLTSWVAGVTAATTSTLEGLL
jgi:uncharacterized membrane-anchored protein